MPRKKNPQRGAAQNLYLERKGKITLDELAMVAGVPKRTISKWKCEDKWEEQLRSLPKKRGGQPGNKNASGKTPAKEGNKNAVTHGAYAHVGAGDISPERAEEIRASTGGSMDRLTEELKALLIRKEYLEQQLEKYTDEQKQQEYYVDKIVHMVVPKTLEDMQAEQDAGIEAGRAEDPEAAAGGRQQGTAEQMKTAMKTIIKASPFDRAMKIEAELTKLHGRILKAIDSMKAYEMEDRRLTLEQRKYELARQRLTGEIEIDDETEEIIDDLTEDS